MMRIEDLFYDVGVQKPIIFSTVDLSNAFFQLPVRKSDRHKLSFITKHGKYQFRRVPFGLASSPTFFTYVMTDVFRPLLQQRKLFVYADDVCVLGKSYEDHRETLLEVFRLLRERGLTLDPKKSKFGFSQVQYLGHVLDARGVTPDPKKCALIRDIQPPRNVKQLQRFLGSANYYKRFSKGYSQIARPLFELLKKDVKYEWNSQCQEAFQKLKDNLISPPILAYPDPSKDYIILCDASSFAVGFCLSQLNDEGHEVVIEYGGRSLSTQERKLSATARELIAVVDSLTKWRDYLYGKKVRIFTDHKPLLDIFRPSNYSRLTGRIARAALLVQEFDYEILYKPGKSNCNADFLSRVPELEDIHHDQSSPVVTTQVLVADCVPAPVLAPQGAETRTSLGSVETTAQEGGVTVPVSWEIHLDVPHMVLAHTPVRIPDLGLRKLQRACPETKEIITYLESNGKKGDIPNVVLHNLDQYTIDHNGLLLHLYLPRAKSLRAYRPIIRQVYLPKKLRHDLLCSYHDLLTHAGFDQVYAAIREKYFWVSIRADINNYIRSCIKCQTHGQKPTPHMISLFHDRSFLACWSLDHTGPLPETREGHKYILVMVENFSRWAELVPVCDTTAETTAVAIYQHLFTRFGMPRTLITDRHRSFVNELLEALCKLLGVKQTFVSPRHPRANGMCERQNQVIKSHLRKVIDPQQCDWHLKLPSVALATRAFPNSSSGFSPAHLMYRRPLDLPLDASLQATTDVDDATIRGSLDLFINNFRMCRELAKMNTQDAAILHQQTANTKHVDKQYKIADLVWVYDDAAPPGLDSRLRPCYKGPFEVVDRKDANYKLKHCITSKLTPYINASRLKKARLPDTDDIRAIPNVVYEDKSTLADRWSAARKRSLEQQRGTADAETKPPRAGAHKGPGGDEVAEIINLRQRNRAKHYFVRLKHAEFPFWISERQAAKRGLHIPPALVEKALRECTWSGTRRRRVRHAQPAEHDRK